MHRGIFRVGLILSSSYLRASPLDPLPMPGWQSIWLPMALWCFLRTTANISILRINFGDPP